MQTELEFGFEFGLDSPSQHLMIIFAYAGGLVSLSIGASFAMPSTRAGRHYRGGNFQIYERCAMRCSVASDSFPLDTIQSFSVDALCLSYM